VLTFSNLTYLATDVGSWLKSLRLHKYANIFASMSYDEMMELTAEKLDEEVCRQYLVFTNLAAR